MCSSLSTVAVTVVRLKTNCWKQTQARGSPRPAFGRCLCLSWSVVPLLPGSGLRIELITATPLVRRGFGAAVDSDLSKQEIVHLQTTNCWRVCFSPVIIHFLWSRNCLNVLMMFLSLCFNELMNSLTHSLLTLQWASNYNTQKMFSVSRNQDSRNLLLGWQND